MDTDRALDILVHQLESLNNRLDRTLDHLDAQEERIRKLEEHKARSIGIVIGLSLAGGSLATAIAKMFGV